ncbi:MAG: tryptophan--tRNA ligase [Acidobacteria bacterium]|nr:tryptophan--tRNA ligase [Acidobacteriota bacterium]
MGSKSGARGPARRAGSEPRRRAHPVHPEQSRGKLSRRVLSGMRPTGKLHLGNYVGALENWLQLQQQYDCFFFIADWHALTTDYADTSQVAQNTLEVATDWLAVGLDPERSTLFVQSRVLEHAELHLLFSMITPTPWLIRNPTIKEQAREMGLISSEEESEVTKINYGLLGYPVLQAADILIYRAHYVPVGQDQVPHVELTREIARRFNSLYVLQSGVQVFPEPEALLTPTPRLPGLDGRKMSKSLGNVIELGENPESIRAKVSTMLTDPQRVRRSDPGRPEICPVFGYHRRFSTRGVIEQVDHECRTAKIGCVDCKALMADHLIRALAPIRERRESYAAKPKAVWDTLAEGSERARRVAQETMQRVREAMKLIPRLSASQTSKSAAGSKRRPSRRLARAARNAP